MPFVLSYVFCDYRVRVYWRHFLSLMGNKNDKIVIQTFFKSYIIVFRIYVTWWLTIFIACNNSPSPICTNLINFSGYAYTIIQTFSWYFILIVFSHYNLRRRSRYSQCHKYRPFTQMVNHVFDYTYGIIAEIYTTHRRKFTCMYSGDASPTMHRWSRIADHGHDLFDFTLQ